MFDIGNHIGWNVYFNDDTSGFQYDKNGYGAMWDYWLNDISLEIAPNNTLWPDASASFQTVISAEFSTWYVWIGLTDAAYRLELPNVWNVSGRARANAWHTYSSRRWKENIVPIDNAIADIQKLQGIRYNWKDEQWGNADIWFIAEDVWAVFPEMVEWDKNWVDANWLAYDRITAVLVEGIKEQQDEIEELKRELESLKKLIIK